MEESDAIEKLPGVGPATAEKLIEAGFTDLMSIAVSSPQNLAEMADIGVNSAVKIIAALLKHLPSDYTYRVVFMRRRLEEILASQKKMLVRRGEPTDTISDEKMAELFRQHLKRIETWLDERPNIKVLYVNYNEVIEKPVEHAQRINQFLGNRLNVENMTGVVDKALYRQRQQ